MKNWRISLLPALLLVAGALYLRSLASWRPQKVFVAPGGSDRLVFSHDGNTLLVVCDPRPTLQFSGKTRRRVLLVLDTRRDFLPLWKSGEYLAHANNLNPRFIANDSRVLLGGTPRQVLDVRTGRTLASESVPFLTRERCIDTTTTSIPVPRATVQIPITFADDAVQTTVLSPDGSYRVVATYMGRLYRLRVK